MGVTGWPSNLVDINHFLLLSLEPEKGKGTYGAKLFKGPSLLEIDVHTENGSITQGTATSHALCILRSWK